MAGRGRGGGGTEVEGDTDASLVSPCHVTLSHSSTYHRWRCVGAEQHLASDDDIACFLLKCYDKRTTSVGEAYCTNCQSPLKLMCVNCGTTGTEASPTATTPLETTSRPAPDSSRNLRSRRKTLPALQNRARTRTRAYLRSKQVPPSPTSKSDSGEIVASPNYQLSNQELVSGKNLCSATPDIGEQLSKNDDKLEDNDAWLVLKAEPVLDVADTTSDMPLSCSNTGGRGRPRKYPPIPLDCCVCGKKLSTRVSVLNHIKKKHPEAELPDFYQSILNSKVSSVKKATKGRKKKKLDSVSEDSKSDRCDVKMFIDEDKSDIDVSEDIVRFGSNSSENKDGSDVNAASEKETKSEIQEASKKLRKAELESLKCATCGVQFEHKRQMYTHRRLCTSKVCHLCGKSVKLLEMHLKRHTSARRFPCPHCPKSFLFPNYLEQHLLYHNNERPYCCEICGMRYREKTRLNAHIRTHTGSKPYKCSQCGAAFTRPRGLNDHMRVHTGEKPYACQVCSRHFSSSGNLAAHRRKVHGLEPQVPNRMTRKLFVVETGVEEGVGEVQINSDTSVGKDVTSDCADGMAGPRSTQPDVSISSEVTQPVSISPVTSPSSGTVPLNPHSSAARAEGSVISRDLMAVEGSVSKSPGVLVNTGFVHSSGLSVPSGHHVNSFVVSTNLEDVDNSRVSFEAADKSGVSLGVADNSRVSFEVNDDSRVPLGVGDNARVPLKRGADNSLDDSTNLGTVFSSVVPLHHRTTTSSVVSWSPGALSQPSVPTSCQQNGSYTDGGVLVGSRILDSNHGGSVNDENPGTVCRLPLVQGVSSTDSGIIINSDASLHSCLLVGAGVPLNSFVPAYSSSGPVSTGVPHDSFVPVSTNSCVPAKTGVSHNPCVPVSTDVLHDSC